ncbi:BON domain-containing protein [Frigoriglobus tundricola]|uniref:BON domain-containing protein n=1 Tax=Frigoriglobus tundricola TaxID=2774151 RepID=A0A6M5YRZ6_9BACT|nr:BON domain-containing protein [Frigoriglobus tundricola]QJW96857.1 hypothetical protein FTUN_4417 [Frigoriglobus tundricola]
MCGLRKWIWAVFAAAAAATPAVAQTSSSTFSGSSGSSGATSTGGSSLSGNSLGGNSSGGGGSGLGGSQQNGTALQGMQQAPSLSAPTGTASTSLSSTNFLSGYYGNPYYQGLITATNNAPPGGFGMALYGNSSGTNGTGSVNRGTSGNNNQNTNQISGILIPIQVQMTYSSQMRFAVPPVQATQMQADLRGAIDGSISNPKSVQVITDANNNVVLRGSVKDDDEVRLIEGLVRITPGVGAITNELTVPRPAVGVAAAGR